LKAVLAKSSNSYSFILSDGTTYNNISATTLEHTWDKSKDVIDSKGDPMRYVIVYGSSAFYYLPSFYGQVVWCVHNLSSSLTPTQFDTSSTHAQYPYSMAYATRAQCVELGDKLTQCSAGSNEKITIVGSAVKLVVDKPVITSQSSGNYLLVNSPSLKEIVFKDGFSNLSNNYQTAGWFRGCNNLKYVEFEKATDYTVANVSCGNRQSSCLQGTEYIKFADGTKSVYLYQMGRLKTLELPSSVTSVHLEGLETLEEITIPSGVTTLTLANGYFTNLKRLVINSSNITSFSVTLNNCARLLEVVLPTDFNFALNLITHKSLTKESIVDMLYKLKDLTGATAKTLTLGTDNLNKLTDEEKAIATDKNRTLT
jgi:hypothetical protein